MKSHKGQNLLRADATGEGVEKLKNSLWIKLYRIPILGRKLFNYKVNKQGGPVRSTLIREFYKKRNVNVKLFTYGGCFSEHFNNGGVVNIGRYCSIAEHVSYFGANHPTTMLSQSALFYNKTLGLDVKDVCRSQLDIGNDVWIGYGVIITAGCKSIGNGAVIGAGAVVTKDVPPYTVVA